jgi:hypothetical protein
MLAVRAAEEAYEHHVARMLLVRDWLTNGTFKQCDTSPDAASAGVVTAKSQK